MVFVLLNENEFVRVEQRPQKIFRRFPFWLNCKQLGRNAFFFFTGNSPQTGQTQLVNNLRLS